MTLQKLFLAAALVLCATLAPSSMAQSQQARINQATKTAVAQATEDAAQQSADAAAAAADAASDAAAAAADAWAADPYADGGGYDSMSKALSIYRSRGSRPAERWIKIFRDDEGWWEADLKTVKIEKHGRLVWMKIPGDEGGYYKSYDLYRCGENIKQLLQYVYYDANDRVESSDSSPGEPKKIVPSTNGEASYEWVCS